MRSTIDSAGRVVIPKEVRRRAGLAPGMPVEVRCVDGRVEIEPPPLKVKLVKRGHLLVAVPEEPIEPLTTEMVERTLDDLRRERVPEA